MESPKNVSLNGLVRFGLTTINPASGSNQYADTTPRWWVTEEHDDAEVTAGSFAVRAAIPGAYKGAFFASGTLGFEVGKNYELWASGRSAGVSNIEKIAHFIVDDIYKANITQVSGIPIHYDDVGPPLYFADIKYIKDNAGPLQDDYAAVWFKNGQIISSGQLTNPAMSVFNAINGNALFSNAVMSYPSTQLGVVQYTQTTTGNLTASGIPYVVRVSGTIDGATRTWPLVVGLDT